MKIVAINGSLRKESFNLKLLNSVKNLLPSEVTSYEVITLENIPMLNQDDLVDGFPESVKNLAEKIEAADAVILATPEYNYSFSAALKNAIDYVSIYPTKPLSKKPIAIMSSSIGLFGGARAQYQLRQVLVNPDCKVISKPEVMLGQAESQFNQAGELTNDHCKDLIKQQLAELLNLCK